MSAFINFFVRLHYSICLFAQIDSQGIGSMHALAVRGSALVEGNSIRFKGLKTDEVCHYALLCKKGLWLAF